MVVFPDIVWHDMGSHVAFVKSKRYTPSVNTQLDYKWQKHRHMGSQKAFGSKLSFWPAGCLHLGMVHQSGWCKSLTWLSTMAAAVWTRLSN